MSEKVSTFSVDRSHAELFSDMLPSDYEGFDEETVMLGAVNEDNYAIGVLWAEFEGMSCVIRHIEVLPEFRRQGVGKKLMNDFLGTFYMIGHICPVYLFFTDEEIMTPFKAFIYSLGKFRIDVDGKLLRYSADSRKNAETYNVLKKNGDSSKCVPFFALPKNERIAMIDKLKVDDAFYPDDLLSDGDDYVKELCYANYDGNDIGTALLFKREAHSLVVSFMYNNGKASAGITDVLAASIVKGDELYPDYDIEASPVSDSVEKFLLKILGNDVTNVPIMKCEWNFG